MLLIRNPRGQGGQIEDRSAGAKQNNVTKTFRGNMPENIPSLRIPEGFLVAVSPARHHRPAQMSRPPSNITAPILSCFNCEFSYGRHPSPQTPQTLQCGHTACFECVNALRDMGKPICPYCGADMGEITPDHTLAAFAEESLATIT